MLFCRGWMIGVLPASGDWPRAAFCRNRWLSRLRIHGGARRRRGAPEHQPVREAAVRLVQLRLGIDPVADVARRGRPGGTHQGVLARRRAAIRRQSNLGRQRRLGLLPLRQFLRTGRAGGRRPQREVRWHRQRRPRRDRELVRRVARQSDGAGQVAAAPASEINPARATKRQTESCTAEREKRMALP